MKTARMALLVAAAALTGCGAPEGGTEGGSDTKAADPKAGWRAPREAFGTPANQPPTGSPQFAARALEDYVHATGRGRDQSTNPAYLAITAPWIPEYFVGDQKILHDPYRLDWASARGMAQDVEFPNRYGARMRGKLFGPRLPYTDPRTGGTHSGPFASVLFIPGHRPPAADSIYEAFAGYEAQLQQLAENGYIVFAIAPQGQEGSEHFTPPHPMCDPDGEWRQPQELGLTEQGECAGHDGPWPALAGEYAAVYTPLESAGDEGATAAFLLQSKLEAEAAAQATIDTYDSFRTRFVFAAFDGVKWLLSDDNPWSDLVDRRRIGIMGHSAGADAALVAANGDPRRRFAAAVTFDGHGLPPDATPARVPTLLQQGENMNVDGPWASAPANQHIPAFRNYATLVDNRVPAMLVTLRGSTHSEWSYIPYRQHNPVVTIAAPFINASSDGDTVGHYYALAWFDRWLHPERAADARSRLLARNFDDSADGTSIGSGGYDLLTQGNVPYRLQGKPVADHLSVWFTSAVAFDRIRCDDWQAGC